MTTFTAGRRGSEWLLHFRHAPRTIARYSRASKPSTPLPFLSWISRRLTRKVEVFFDVQSFGFEYSKVFGGGRGGGLDFAVSYEDLLFDLSKGHDFHSSEEDEET
nr:hypothetical protein CFP56_06439 [Quercus suber]